MREHVRLNRRSLSAGLPSLLLDDVQNYIAYPGNNHLDGLPARMLMRQRKLREELLGKEEEAELT